MMENISNLDFGKILEFVLKIILEVLKIPIKIWKMIPAPIRIGIGIFIFILSIVIGILAYKNRDAWRNVVY